MPIPAMHRWLALTPIKSAKAYIRTSSAQASSTLICALFIFALSLTVMIGPAGSTPPPSFPEINYETDTVASLNIQIFHHEDTYVSLWYEPPFPEQSEANPEKLSADMPNLPDSWKTDSWKNEWQATLSAATNCGSNDLTTEVVDGYLSIEGDCGSVIKTVGAQQQGSLNLAPLLAALADINIDYLTVSLGLPSVGSANVDPAGTWPYDDDEGFQKRSWDVPTEHYYDIATANPQITQVSYGYGFTQSQVTWRAIGLGLVLLLPLAGVFWLRSRTLRLHAQSPKTPLWFGYQRSVSSLSIAVWVLWLAAAFATELSDWLPPLLFPSMSADWLEVVSLALFLWPPSIIDVAITTLSHRVSKEVGQLDYSWAESLLMTVAIKAVVILPLTFLSLAWLMFEGDMVAVGIGGVAFLSLMIAFEGLRKLRDWTPHAITTGELRDRIFQLAQPTGIQLNQIYLLPMKRSRMVNAFALRNNSVMVTDYLLKQLNKAEVDGIMAHELAHLQLGHPTKLVVRLVLLFVVAVWLVPTFSTLLLALTPFVSFANSSYIFALQILLALTGFYSLFYSTSRKFEYQADAQAALITGNPQALITGLVKIAHLNQMPLQWGKLGETMMTHPSMQRRVDAIAQRYSIPSKEVDTLLATAAQPTPDSPESVPADTTEGQTADHYDVNALITGSGSSQAITISPPAQASRSQTSHSQENPSQESPSQETSANNPIEHPLPDPAPDQKPASDFTPEHTPLLSTQFKQHTSQRFMRLIWLCFSLGPVILGRLVQLLPTPGLRWLGYGCAAIAIISLYIYITNTSATHGYPKLLSQFAQRLKAEGFEPNSGTFIGFAPSAETRIYEGHSIWDMGWLRLADNQLYYVGEKLRFALNTHQITHIELQKDATNFIPSYAIVITWQGPALKHQDFAQQDFNGQTFRLQPLQAQSLSQLKPVAQALRNKLEDWHVGKHPETLTEVVEQDRLRSLQPHALGDITSSPMPTLNLAVIFSVWVNFMLIAFAIALFTGSLSITPVLTTFIFTMATLGAALQLWPTFKRTLQQSR